MHKPHEIMFTCVYCDCVVDTKIIKKKDNVKGLPVYIIDKVPTAIDKSYVCDCCADGIF